MECSCASTAPSAKAMHVCASVHASKTTLLSSAHLATCSYIPGVNIISLNYSPETIPLSVPSGNAAINVGGLSWGLVICASQVILLQSQEH